MPDLDGQKNGANAVRCGPVLLQDVQTDVARVVHVGVEARRIEAHKWRLKRVVLQSTPITTRSSTLSIRPLPAKRHSALSNLLLDAQRVCVPMTADESSISAHRWKFQGHLVAEALVDCACRAADGRHPGEQRVAVWKRRHSCARSETTLAHVARVSIDILHRMT